MILPGWLRTAAALSAAVLGAGCGSAVTGDPGSASRPAPTPLHGEAARAAHAVTALAGALRDRDVERLCTPGAILTPAVVAELEATGPSCEALLELSREVRHPPVLTVTRVTLEPGLATAQVRVGRGSTVPLDVVRRGRRWLVSFSDGSDPLGALQQAMSQAG